jgi:succinate dehydrogenase / fumarate reductase cytochrome b subunit
MPKLMQALSSQVGRKILTGVTGVSLILFVIVHLLGNFTLFGSPEAFNAYAHTLESLGPLLIVAEIGLIAVFLIHAWIGLSIWWNRRKARPQAYSVYSSKGGPSRQTLGSRSMAFTGIVLLIFVVVHVRMFKFGETAMVALSDGSMARDLKTLVIETFLRPEWAFGYTLVMVLLGIHLGHGVWSAMTSLTMRSRQMSALVYTAGTVIAGALAIGFLSIPLYIYFTGGQGSLLQF